MVTAVGIYVTFYLVLMINYHILSKLVMFYSIVLQVSSQN